MLNSSINFSIITLVVKEYRADTTIIEDSKLYTSTLTLSSYLSTN